MADFPPIVFASKSGTSFRSAGTGFAHAWDDNLTILFFFFNIVLYGF